MLMTRIKKKYRSPAYYLYVAVYAVYVVCLIFGFLRDLPVIGGFFGLFKYITDSKVFSNLVTFAGATFFMYYFSKGQEGEEKEIKKNREALAKQEKEDKEKMAQMIQKPFKPFEDIASTMVDESIGVINEPKKLEYQDEIETAVEVAEPKTVDVPVTNKDEDALYSDGTMHLF